MDRKFYPSWGKKKKKNVKDGKAVAGLHLIPLQRPHACSN